VPQSNGKKQDVLRNLFDAGVKAKFKLGAFEDFPQTLTKPQSRVNLFQAMSPTHDLGTFEDFEATLEPFLPKTGISKIVSNIVSEIDRSKFFQNLIPKSRELADVPGTSITRFAAGGPKKREKDRQEVQDRMLPLALRAPVLQKILDEPEALNALSFEEIMNMAPMLGITRGDMFEALGPTLDKDNVLGFIKNILTGPILPGQVPREGVFAEALDKPLVDLTSFLPDDPPVDFAVPEFRGLTEKGQKIGWSFTKGTLRFLEGFLTPSNVMLMGSIGLTTKTKDIGTAFFPAIFSADMIAQNPALIRAIVDAFEEGDTDEAIQLSAVLLLTNLLAGVLGKEAFKRIKEGKNIISPESKPIWDDLRAALEQEGIEGKVEESIVKVDKWTKDNARALAKIAQLMDEKAISKEGVDVTERARAIDEAMATLDLKNQLVMKGAILKESRRPSGEERAAQPMVLAEEIGIRRVRGKDVVETKKINDPQTKFEKDVEVVKDISENTKDTKVKEETTELAKEGEGLKNIDEVQVRFEEFLKEKNVGRNKDLLTINDKITIGKDIPAEAVKAFEDAAIFLSKRFPRLFDAVDRLDLLSDLDYRRSAAKLFVGKDPSLVEETVGFFEITETGEHFLTLKANNLLSEPIKTALPERSPQVELEPKSLRGLAKNVNVLSEIDAVRTMAHEMRHLLDDRTFGPKITEAMDEVGKILGKAELQAKAKRINERGLKPQRYRVMLSERRSRAQERTVIKSLREAMRESIRGFLELLGGDPSILAAGLPLFTEAGYVRAKPHIEQAWKNYKKAGADFAEFSKELIEEFGDNAKPYLDKMRAEFNAQGTDIGEGIKDIEIEHPDFAEPDPSSLPPDISIDVKLEAYKDVRERIRAHGKKWQEALADIFSVEAKGIRIGAKETALAMKNFFGEEFRHQDQALNLAEKVVADLRTTSKDFRFKPDKPALQELALFMEDIKGISPAQSKRYNKSLSAWTGYKQFAINIYKRHGELPNFTKHVNAAIKAEKFKRAGENTADIDAIVEIVAKAKPATFEASLFLENFIRNTPDKAAGFYLNLLKEETKGGRLILKTNSLSLRDIIEHGVPLEEINAVDLIAGLGRRLGQDSGILNIRSAAIKEGLAKKFSSDKEVKITESPFARSEARYFEDYVVHPILNSWLTRMSRPGWKAFDIISHGIAAVKMNSFVNPLFLPMYDIFQSAMLGSLKPHMVGTAIGGIIGGIPGAALGFAAGEAVTLTLAKGFYHSIAKTPLYFHALSGGLSSKPFPNPLSSFTDMKNHIKVSLTPRVGQLFASAISNGVELSKAVVGLEAYKRYQTGDRMFKIIAGLPPFQVIKQMYNLSHGIAWQLDRGVRMANYIWLRQGKGFKEIKFPKEGEGTIFRTAMGHIEAAQLTALANADYAAVPSMTRKILNIPFFTPTFKIAMAKFYKDMIVATIKGVGRGADLTLKGIFKTEKMSKRDKVLAWGMFNTMAIGLGLHMYMISQGFKTVVPFVKYKRPTITDEGPQDIVTNFSAPSNLFIKYAFRIYNSLFRASPTPELRRLVNSFKWEFTPLLRVAGNMVDNRDDSGDAIVLTTDSRLEGYVKLTKYALLNTVQLIKLIEPDQSGVEARRALAKEAGQLHAIATAPFVFNYLKDPDAQIAQSQINQMETTFWNDVKEGRISFTDIDAHALVLIDKINDILETRGLIRQQ